MVEFPQVRIGVFRLCLWGVLALSLSGATLQAADGVRIVPLVRDGQVLVTGGVQRVRGPATGVAGGVPARIGVAGTGVAAPGVAAAWSKRASTAPATRASAPRTIRSRQGTAQLSTTILRSA